MKKLVSDRYSFCNKIQYAICYSTACFFIFPYGLKVKVLNANKYTIDRFNISSAKHLFSFVIVRFLHFKM